MVTSITFGKCCLGHSKELDKCCGGIAFGDFHGKEKNLTDFWGSPLLLFSTVSMML